MNGRAAAVAAARRGWAVFPCRPGDKRPAVPDWEHRACSDPERVARYWPSSSHNVGIACGPSGLTVVDLDPPDGRAHLETLGHGIPGTFTVSTSRPGGRHLYFTTAPGLVIRNSAGRIAPHVDIRGSGGFVVGPGSMVGGRSYEIVNDSAPATLPPWLAELALPPPRPPAAAQPVRDWSPTGRLRGVLAVVLGAREGERNNSLHWAACRCAEMVAAGELAETAAETALTTAALEAGLEPGETGRTIASAFRRVMA